MNSFLGLHIASPVRYRFGDFLSMPAAAGGYLPLVVTIDQSVQQEVKAVSERTLTAWRTQKSPMGEDNPPGFMDHKLEDMPDLAVHWMNSLWPYWVTNRHDVLIINNEQDIGTLEHSQKLNAFNMRCMDVADSWGIPIGICSFGTGNPSDDAGLTLEQRWVPMIPSIRRAAMGGHYLVLHAHAAQYSPLMNCENTIAFRHERSLRFFNAHGIQPGRKWVIIGELSNGGGGVEPNVTEYMRNVKWWDERAYNSVYSEDVVGGALYGYNAAETLRPAADQLIDWITLRSRPDPIPQPVHETTVTFDGDGLSVTYRDGPAQIYLPFGTKYTVTRK